MGILTYLVPQACWTEPALRRGCIALGALHLGRLGEFSNSATSMKHDSKRFYEKALEHYQRAIKDMRDVKDIRTALIACLIIFCAEISVGSVDLALGQILSGVKLLKRYDHSANSRQARRRDKVEDELVAAFKTLEIRKLRYFKLLLRRARTLLFASRGLPKLTLTR